MTSTCRRATASFPFSRSRCIRTAHETTAGLRARAEESGLSYQTLAASVLHMVAKGDLKLSLAPGR